MTEKIILTEEEEKLILKRRELISSSNRRKREASKEAANKVKEGWDKLPTTEQFIGNIDDQRISITQRSITIRELDLWDAQRWAELLRQVYELKQYKETRLRFIYLSLKINIIIHSINNKVIECSSTIRSIEGYENAFFGFFIPEDYNFNLKSFLKALVNCFQKECKKLTEEDKKFIEQYKNNIKRIEENIKNRSKLKVKCSDLLKSLKKTNLEDLEFKGF